MAIHVDSTAADLDHAVTASEAEIVRQYDQQRRQRLLILLGTIFGGAIGLLFIVLLALLLTQGHFGVTEWVEVVGTALNGLLYLGVIWLARAGQVGWASALFAVGAGIVPNLNVFLSSATGGASPFTVAILLGAIVVVSLAGHPWMVASTALLSSLTTIYMVDFAPVPATTPAQAALRTYLAAVGNSNLPILFVIYWGMTLLLLAQWRSYQRLLLELTGARVQVERARQLDELKDQFIRSVNHELRTPIMTLLGYVDLLLNPDNRRSDEKVERYLQRAERAGQSLRRLLAGILDTRHLITTTETLQPEALDVQTVLEDVIPLLPIDASLATSNGATERPLRIHLSPDLCVWAEPIQFQQVLLNLLSNAVKYSAAGTAVEVEAKIITGGPGEARRANGAKWGTRHLIWFQKPAAPPPMVEIAVRDYGLGIPPEHQPLLFQRFMRLPRDLESQVMGTGLGLYLCKLMVERMGGSIQVESSGIPGEGTTFRIQLPIPPDTPNAPEVQEQQQHEKVTNFI